MSLWLSALVRGTWESGIGTSANPPEPEPEGPAPQGINFVFLSEGDYGTSTNFTF